MFKKWPSLGRFRGRPTIENKRGGWCRAPGASAHGAAPLLFSTRASPRPLLMCGASPLCCLMFAYLGPFRSGHRLKPFGNLLGRQTDPESAQGNLALWQESSRTHFLVAIRFPTYPTRCFRCIWNLFGRYFRQDPSKGHFRNPFEAPWSPMSAPKSVPTRDRCRSRISKRFFDRSWSRLVLVSASRIRQLPLSWLLPAGNWEPSRVDSWSRFGAISYRFYRFWECFRME